MEFPNAIVSEVLTANQVREAMAAIQPDLSPGQHLSKGAFTLIELLVVVAIIGILASLLLPALSRARDKGKTAKSQSNLRQLGLAAMLYDEEHLVYPIGWPLADGFTGAAFPIWYRQLQSYLGRNTKVSGQGIFICPSSLQKAQPDEKIGGPREGGFLGVPRLRAKLLYQQWPAGHRLVTLAATFIEFPNSLRAVSVNSLAISSDSGSLALHE